MTTQYLTPGEVRKLLRVRAAKVLGDIRAGRLPAINLSDTAKPRYRIARESLDAYLQARAVVPETRPAKQQRREIPQHVRRGGRT